MADTIPYDPDFDDERSSETVGTTGPSPRFAFVAGLVTSILVMATIGFVALLALLFR